jgi:DMSO/TMAO reductase YedYZ heme-binding membrane subunit
VVLGIIASIGWTTVRWPRFLSQSIHRNLSLLCLGFVGVHVVTTVADGYVPIRLLDVVVPFRSPYRPLWVGFGALSFDLLLALLVTSALRHRIGYDSWRFVHWLAYLCWPIALVHGLGTGSDATDAPTLAVDAICAGAVLGAAAWRLAADTTSGVQRRVALAAMAVIVTVGIGTFTALGPLRPGWSHRAGTSEGLLAQIAAEAEGGAAPPITAPTVAGTPLPSAATPSPGHIPAPPFSMAVAGTQASQPDGSGRVQITLALRLADAASTPLTIILDGAAVAGGGVSLSDGSVSYGPYRGTVTSLEGDTIDATVPGDGPLGLAVVLDVDQATGALSGTVSGTLAGVGR